MAACFAVVAIFARVILKRVPPGKLRRFFTWPHRDL